MIGFLSRFHLVLDKSREGVKETATGMWPRRVGGGKAGEDLATDLLLASTLPTTSPRTRLLRAPACRPEGNPWSGSTWLPLPLDGWLPLGLGQKLWGGGSRMEFGRKLGLEYNLWACPLSSASWEQTQDAAENHCVYQKPMNGGRDLLLVLAVLWGNKGHGQEHWSVGVDTAPLQ